MKILDRFLKLFKKEPPYTIKDLPIGYRLERNSFDNIRYVDSRGNPSTYTYNTIHDAISIIKIQVDRDQRELEYRKKYTEWKPIIQDDII